MAGGLRREIAYVGNLEASYLASLTPCLGLHADLQYVIHPDTDPTRSDAVVAGLRLRAAF